MKRAAIFLLFAGIALPAGDPEGFHLWTAADLQARGKALVSKLNAQKSGSDSLSTVGNSTFSVSRREGNGEAELHATQADIFVVQTGEATLQVGGTVENPRSTGPNETRGASISGASEKKLSPGDVVVIPAKTPHRVMIAAGKELTYFLVKVTQ